MVWHTHTDGGWAGEGALKEQGKTENGSKPHNLMVNLGSLAGWQYGVYFTWQYDVCLLGLLCVWALLPRAWGVMLQ